MGNFNYFKPDRVYNELYYQFPKVFLVSEEYRKMSDSTKIAYMLLKARLQSAIAKRQIDEDGNIYFTYTTKELCNVLNCQKQKVIAIKKSLEEYGLLLQKNMGFDNNKGKYHANRLYLAELSVTENDIYLLEKFDADNKQSIEESEGMKITPCQHNFEQPETVGAQEGMKITPSQNVDKSEGMKITHVFNNNNLDTNRHLIDTEKENYQDQVLLDNFVEIMKDESISTFIPEKVLNIIKVFSPTYEEAQKTVRTIHNAKRKAQDATGVTVIFEHLNNYGIDAEQRLYNTLLKAYQKQKTEKVNNIQNLIFTYVKNWFVEYPCAAIAQMDSGLTATSGINWENSEVWKN